MSRRRIAFLIVSTLIAAACSRETPTPSPKSAKPAPPPDLSTAKIDKTLIPDAALDFVAGSMLGSLLDRDGNVLGDKTTFRKGDRIALTMRFRESPLGLRASAVFGEKYGKDLVTQQKDMNGAKVVTFMIPKGLPPGQYRVTGYWGGNVAVEREFQVLK
ncbi:MAG: hypothetical protein QOI24_3184 [Acidobacteriota bacterium]|jgi:hypothetical protein|nr:hypothetical protein [Acidobacteriota bacterium]